MTRYVIDTVGLINYFNLYFEEKDILSKETREIVRKCFDISYNNFKLMIPSVVFVEIFKKFLLTEEDSLRFYYEIYSQIKECEDIEIKPFERDLLHIFGSINSDYSLELHDRVVFSAALQLQAPLITNDNKIIKANREFRHPIIF